MEGDRTLYEVLGVTESASTQELVKARRRQLKRSHPDLNPDDPEASTERFVSIELAFQTLLDSRRRSADDGEQAPATGGWLRGVVVDSPEWRPPAWSWVGADPVWDLQRHLRFFVSTLSSLPDTEAVMLSTAYRRGALLVTDRRLIYVGGRFRRRVREIQLNELARVCLVPRGPVATLRLFTSTRRHRFVLPALLAQAVDDAVRSVRSSHDAC